MNMRSWQPRKLAFGVMVVSGAIVLAVQPADAQVIRTFDSVPVNDSLMNADANVDPDGTGNGGKLGTVTPLGGGSSSFNNTAAPGFGMDAAAYGGAYRIWGSNLTSELGTTSLSNFTIAYAYKPDSPNHPDSNKSARQLRMSHTSFGTTSLTISFTGRRQLVQLNQYNTADPLEPAQLFDFGAPAGGPNGPAARLMDGDPMTTFASGGPAYNANNATEWVFYAMTYEAIDATHARVTQYGQVAGGDLTQFHQSGSIDMSASSMGSTFNIESQVLDLGSALFADNYRPYDAHFDNFGFYPTALTTEQIAALGNAVFTEPAFDPGDHNEDGVVDIRDYAVWRSNPSAHGGDNGYDAWAAGYDPATPGSGSSAVPEPAAAVSILVGGTLLAGYRRRRSSL